MESSCETLNFSQYHLSVMMIAYGRRGTIDSEKTFVGIWTDLMKIMNLLWVDFDFRKYYLVIIIIITTYYYYYYISQNYFTLYLKN